LAGWPGRKPLSRAENPPIAFIGELKKQVRVGLVPRGEGQSAIPDRADAVHGPQIPTQQNEDSQEGPPPLGRCAIEGIARHPYSPQFPASPAGSAESCKEADPARLNRRACVSPALFSCACNIQHQTSPEARPYVAHMHVSIELRDGVNTIPCVVGRGASVPRSQLCNSVFSSMVSIGPSARVRQRKLLLILIFLLTRL
jgi:hypothetical protein